MKKPSFFFYYLAALILIPFLRIKYNYKIKKTKIIKEPFVVIANHQAVLDPLFLAASFFPKRLNFVGGYELLLKRKTRFFMRVFRIIPKFQYQIELNAIKQMLLVIRNGGNLALFPTGRLSNSGEGFEATPALVKLLKKLNVNVYFCKISGAYFSMPKWAKHKRKGKVTLEQSLLFSKEDLKSIDEKSLLEQINKNLYFNVYEEQTKEMIAYQGKKLAENLEGILYLCPKCKKEFFLETKDNLISCSFCNFNTTIDEFGYFLPNPYFKNPLEWFKYQEQEMKKNIIDNLSFYLFENVCVKSPVQKKMEYVGKGTIYLENNNFIYKGVLFEKNTTFEVNLKDVPSLPFRAGVNIEIPYQDKIFVFELENGVAAAKWSIAVEQIHVILNSNK